MSYTSDFRAEKQAENSENEEFLDGYLSASEEEQMREREASFVYSKEDEVGVISQLLHARHLAGTPDSEDSLKIVESPFLQQRKRGRPVKKIVKPDENNNNVLKNAKLIDNVVLKRGRGRPPKKSSADKDSSKNETKRKISEAKTSMAKDGKTRKTHSTDKTEKALNEVQAFLKSSCKKSSEILSSTTTLHDAYIREFRGVKLLAKNVFSSSMRTLGYRFATIGNVRYWKFVVSQ